MGGSTGWNVTSNPLGVDASNSLDVTSPKWKSVPCEQGHVGTTDTPLFPPGSSSGPRRHRMSGASLPRPASAAPHRRRGHRTRTERGPHVMFFGTGTLDVLVVS